MATDNFFVQLPFTTSQQDLADIAIAFLQSQWPDWNPNDGDPEVILTEANALIGENAASQASNMPLYALINFGTQLLQIPYGNGTSAYTTVTLTMQDAAGYTCKQGGQINIDNFAFALTEDAVVPAGETTVDVLVASIDWTAAANGLTGTTELSNLSLESWVTAIQVLYPTQDGADPQTDISNVNQVSRDRRLASRGLITNLDFELAALDQPNIGRAHAETDGARNTTVTIADLNGMPTDTPTKTALADYYATLRMANTVVSIIDPTMNQVSVVWAAVAEAGYDPTDLTARVNAALEGELAPLGWGAPSAGDPGSGVTTWDNELTIYQSRLATVIGNVLGTYRVVSVALSGTYAAQLTAALSTAAAITSLPISGLLNTIPSGSTIVLAFGSDVQSWVTTAQANPGDSQIQVQSQTPNFAYPTITQISGPVAGDFLMHGATPLPQLVNVSGSVTVLS